MLGVAHVVFVALELGRQLKVAHGCRGSWANEDRAGGNEERRGAQEGNSCSAGSKAHAVSAGEEVVLACRAGSYSLLT